MNMKAERWGKVFVRSGSIWTPVRAFSSARSQKSKCFSEVHGWQESQTEMPLSTCFVRLLWSCEYLNGQPIVKLCITWLQAELNLSKRSKTLWKTAFTEEARRLAAVILPRKKITFKVTLTQRGIWLGHWQGLEFNYSPLKAKCAVV